MSRQIFRTAKAITLYLFKTESNTRMFRQLLIILQLLLMVFGLLLLSWSGWSSVDLIDVGGPAD